MTRSETAATPATDSYQPTEAFAQQQDERDPLAGYRERFCCPQTPDGNRVMYFAGNSLGLQPDKARQYVEQEIEDWQTLAVKAHLDGRTPWFSYHEVLSESGARLVGAKPGGGEVVFMNSLTVNIHLMLVTFYQPTKTRYKIMVERPAFPSDLYAVTTHMRTRGIDPKDGLLQLAPREGEHTLRTEDIEAVLDEQGDEIALVMFGCPNFYTGQVFDIERITAAGKSKGCAVGFDLAHGAGNIAPRLHDWDVDFAMWCSYKYLNGGPGAVGGCFVHERHGNNLDLPRYAGWWGDDPQDRFQMHLQRPFVPQGGADGWQLSNPPILAMAALRASLEMFDEAGIDTLREKSKKLTGYLRFLIERAGADGYEIITPSDPDAQGCQLSILVHDKPQERFQALLDAGVICDFREPNVIRVAPTPFYNTFHEAWRFAQILTG